MMGELREIHIAHGKYILEQRNAFVLKENIRKVTDAIQSKTTDNITGK